MSVIAVLGRAGPVAAAKLRRPAASGCFQVDNDSELNASVSVAAPAFVGLHGLLALQEVEAEARPDRAARRRAGAMLAELSAMQRALLGGDASGLSAAIDGLSGLARDGTAALDPRLNAVLRAITMRAEIETARHATFPQHPAATR